LISGHYKLVLGVATKNYQINYAYLETEDTNTTCTRDVSGGCLINVFSDPSDATNLAESHCEIFYVV